MANNTMGPFNNLTQTPPAQGFWSSLGQNVTNAFNNPNILRTMADLGTQIDPQGAGGIIGKAATGMIAREQQAKSISDAFQKQQLNLNAILDALSGQNNFTGAKVGADGSLELTGAAGTSGTDNGQTLQPSATSNNVPQNIGVNNDYESILDNMLNWGR